MSRSRASHTGQLSITFPLGWGGKRLHAGVPSDWRVADKTGTGRLGTTNDVGVLWPPHRAPLVVVSYLTECKAPVDAREAALANVARAVTGARRRPAA